MTTTLRNALVVGMLSVSMAALTGCAGTDGQELSGDTEEDALKRAPNFAGSGAGTPIEVDDRQAKLMKVSSEVATAMRHMTKDNDLQNTEFHAGLYKFEPQQLDDWNEELNGHITQKFMAYQMMFRVDGSRPDSNVSTGLSGFDKWNPEYETMNVTAIAKTSVLATYKKFQAYTTAQGDTQISAAKRQDIQTNAEIAVQAFLKGLGKDAIYKCHWDNNDDTDVDALISLDFKTGEVRVLLAFAGG